MATLTRTIRLQTQMPTLLPPCLTCLPCLPANLLHTLALILPAYLIIYLPTNLYFFLLPNYLPQ